MTIGLTGGIGSGKSIVAKVLESMGYPVFYSDLEAKKLMHSDHQLRSEIIGYFGEEAYENGVLNRAYLAQRIFSNPQDKAVLNNLIHPKVRAAFRKFADSAKSQLVFNEAAILFETGAHAHFEKIILVTAPEKTRIDRVMKRDQTTRQEVLERMSNQWSDDRKIPLADYVIQNGNQDKVLAQIEEVVSNLLD